MAGITRRPPIAEQYQPATCDQDQRRKYRLLRAKGPGKPTGKTNQTKGSDASKAASIRCLSRHPSALHPYQQAAGRNSDPGRR